MRRFLDSKFVYGAVLSTFAMAFACHAGQGASAPAAGHITATPAQIMVAHGPSIPPDPWEGTGSSIRVAHGPSIPPDPWEGTGSSVA